MQAVAPVDEKRIGSAHGGEDLEEVDEEELDERRERD